MDAQPIHVQMHRTLSANAKLGVLLPRTGPALAARVGAIIRLVQEVGRHLNKRMYVRMRRYFRDQDIGLTTCQPEKFQCANQLSRAQKTFV